MIYFPTIGAYGRLGNQLFQYAAARSLSLKHKTSLSINHVFTSEWHGQQCLLPFFNIKTAEKTEEKPTYAWEEPNPFELYKDYYSLPDGVSIKGFFQSLFYFEDYTETIKDELSLKKRTSTYVSDLRTRVGREVISIHLRRGDNTDGTDPSQSKLIDHYRRGGRYEKYIDEAVDHFPSAHFLIFTGGRRYTKDNSGDVEWCRNFFKVKGWKNHENYSLSKGRSTLEDFELISSCDHNILSHVSSFGWWAAFQNINKGSKKVAPLNYHPDLDDYTHREKFYPHEWIII